jgi:hypothetical protein
MQTGEKQLSSGADLFISHDKIAMEMAQQLIGDDAGAGAFHALWRWTCKQRWGFRRRDGCTSRVALTMDDNKTNNDRHFR